MIVIVDYGMGNLQSILSKIKRLKHEAIVSSRIEDIEAAAKIILPGVGHFAAGMANIRTRGLLNVLNKKVMQDKTPILGICLGMQLMTHFSEEGDVEGFKWVHARTQRFISTLRIPHVGWNKVFFKKDSILFKGIASGQRFYFTHSYHLSCQFVQDVAAVTEYGYEFVAAIEKGNILGVQFHPEKSHDHGLVMIDNFLRYA